MKHYFSLILAASALLSGCSTGPLTNVALHRAATASSNFDVNLTAQLLTDGLLCEEPAYLDLITSDGAVDKVERECSIDNDLLSRNILNGATGWMEFHFHGYTVKADKAEVLFQEALGGGNRWPTSTVTLPVETLEDGALKFSLEFPHEGRWRIKDVKFFDNGTNLGNLLPTGHFTSAWMSEGNKDEWVMVDLGAQTRIHGVKMHWIARPESGYVEVSKDGTEWDRKEDLAKGDSLSFSAKCRYVRIRMNGGPQRFCMTELEVTGEQKEAPAPAADRWMLQRASEVDAGGEALSTAGHPCSGWIPATVPGTILSSFIDLGAVPDPDFGDNWSQISESYFNSDFWYRREFEQQKTEGKRYFLEMDGVNWKADIYLNGSRLDDINGAFIRSRQDITDILQNGSNALAIKIIRNAHPGAVKTKTAKWTGYNGGVLGADSPTYLASIGWDWMTTVRGRNCGIWDDVRITEKGSAQLSDPLVRTIVSKDGKASVSASILLNCSGPAEIEGWIGDVKFSKTVDCSGEVAFTPEEFPQLKDTGLGLWWPNGTGLPPTLHDAGFSVRTDGELSDSLHFKAGLREIKTTEEGGALKIFVNGVRINPMGGNWGFCQQNLRYSAQEYLEAVNYNQQMNFNMIRNWVGQIGHKAFYDACDRCGILVWQDFWLANPLDGPDPDDGEMFLENAKDYVGRIRSHPCVALYCGRNEGYPPKTIDKALRDDVVAKLHPDIAYISSSADGPVGGRGPYKAYPVEYYFSKPFEKLHSERGLPNIPEYESLRKMMPSEDLWPRGEMWGKHDFTRDGAQSSGAYLKLLEDAFGEIDGAEQFAGLSQWLDFEGCRAIFEGANATGRQGMLLWMSHSCWPSLVFCTYDYYMRQGGGFWGSKKGCEPLHIQYNPISGKVEVVNNSQWELSETWAKATTYSLEGECLSDYMAIISCPEDSTKELFEVEKPEGKEPYFISLDLSSQNGANYSTNFYMMPGENGLKELRKLPKAELETETDIEKDAIYFRVANTGKTPALMLRVTLRNGDGEEVLPICYSDNYFSLMPGEEKWVHILWPEHVKVTNPTVTVKQFQENF